MMSAEDLINLTSMKKKKNNVFKTIVMSLSVYKSRNVVSILFPQNQQWLRSITLLHWY